jgi:hypothetical protein
MKQTRDYLQEWERVKTKNANTNRNVLFTKFAYQDNAIKQANLEEIAQQMGVSHKLFLFSDYLEDTKGGEYRCAVFVDHDKKQVVFANAGTRPGANNKGLHDFVADAALIAQIEPHKLMYARQLNTLVLDNLNDQVAEYEFHYTGHSLGAAMADMQAADMYLQMRNREIDITDNQISTQTFDNPGAKPIVDKMFRAAGLDSSDSRVKHKTVNNGKNFINTLNPQVGSIYEMPQSPLSYSEQIVDLTAKLIKAFIPFEGAIIDKICGWISYGSISRQVAGHKLDNFENALLKIAKSKEPKDIEYNQVFYDQLTALRAEQNNSNLGTQIYSMNAPDGAKITFSRIELDAVTKVLKRSQGDNVVDVLSSVESNFRSR